MLKIILVLLAFASPSFANQGGPQGGGPGNSGNGDGNGQSFCPPGLDHPDCR